MPRRDDDYSGADIDPTNRSSVNIKIKDSNVSNSVTADNSVYFKDSRAYPNKSAKQRSPAMTDRSGNSTFRARQNGDYRDEIEFKDEMS
jgi:hypothetical protein